MHTLSRPFGRWRVAALGAVAAMTVLFAGCGPDTSPGTPSSVGAGSEARDAGASGSATASGPAASRPPGTQPGDIPPAPPLVRPPAPPATSESARISLPSTEIVAGQKVTVTLVVSNPTGTPLDVMGAGGCTPKWAIGLSGPELGVTFQPIFTLECGLAPLVIPPGTTELRSTLMTSYSACTTEGVPGPDSPRCLPGGRTPPLPPGDYTTVFVGELSGVAGPAPVKVRLVP